MTAMHDKELSLLSIQEGQVTFNNEQKTALIDVLRVKHATEADLAVFFHLCRQRELDPFLRQIYMIARQEWDKEANAKVWRQTFQTGIDGFRTIASRRAAKLHTSLSYEPTIYVGSDGVGHEYWVGEEPPAAVKVTVKLGDAPFPFVARYSDYAVMTDEYESDTFENGKKIKGKKTGRRVPSGMWATRPTAQLEKCAEAAALRRACPEDLGGIYEFSELEREEHEPAITTLVDDGASAKPKAKGTNWVHKVRMAKTREDLSKIWADARAAGQKTAELERAIKDKGARIQAAAATEKTEGDTKEGEAIQDVSAAPEPPEPESLMEQARANTVVHAPDDWSKTDLGQAEDSTACGRGYGELGAFDLLVRDPGYAYRDVTCPACREVLGMNDGDES